jgi:hypothetical protein
MGDYDERNLMRLAAISLWSSSLLQLKFLSTNIVQKIGSDNGNYRRQSVCRPFAVIRELIMLSDVRYWSNSGQRPILAGHGLSANDPKRT